MSIFAPVFDVRLDPPAVATGRAELKLNDGPIRIDVGGIDWGDAALQAYMSDMLVGSSAVDYRIPNRNVVIPLFVGADESDDFDYAKGQLMQKVGRLQEEGGWLQRQVGLYADVVNATLVFPDVWGEAAGVEPNVVLTLECLPDFYGDEIALDALTTSTTPAGLTPISADCLFGSLQAGGVQAMIRGNHPARYRIAVANGSGSPRVLGMFWGVRSRYADSGGTARLAYKAIDLTGVNTTAPAAGVMTNLNLSLNAWLSVLTTEISALEARNVCLNGGFEHDTTTPAAWSTSGVNLLGGGTGVTASIAGAAQSGTKCMKVVTTTATAQQGVTSQVLAVGAYIPGQVYRAQCYVKGNVGGEQVQLCLGNAFAVGLSSTITLTTAWQLVSVVATIPPADTQAIYVSVRSATATSMTFFVDSVVVTPTSAVYAYFDGDTAGYRWLGPVGNSVSSSPVLQMTHRGSYNFWARVSSPSNPLVRLMWGVGAAAAPQYNAAVTLSAPVNTSALLDLGEIRLDAPPVGPMQWFGAIQASGDVAGADLTIESVYLQPLAEGAGRLVYNANAPAITSAVTKPPGAGANTAGVGTLVWSTPGNILALDGSYASVVFSTSGQTTNWLVASNFGFAVPSMAVIVGVVATVWRSASSSTDIQDSSVKLNLGVDRAAVGVNWPGVMTSTTYGGPTDLWGASLAPSDTNASSFALMISATSTLALAVNADVDYVTLTVYYTLSTGLAVDGDAVIYAATSTPNQIACEMRTEGMFRNDPTGQVYGEASRVIGDLPRLPVSGMEKRPVEVFAKVSAGDLASLPDTTMNGIGQIQAYYRPSYLFPP